MTTQPPNSPTGGSTRDLSSAARPRMQDGRDPSAPTRYAILLLTSVAIGAFVALLLWPRAAIPLAPITVEEAGVRAELITTPVHLMPGETTKLTYRLSDTDTGAPVTNLVAGRKGGLQMLLVSSDLTDIRRVTAAEISPGVFQLSFTPIADTRYVSYATFMRAGREVADVRYLTAHSGQVLLPNVRTDVEVKLVDAFRILSSALVAELR